jgi:hypothetical protein
MIGPALPWISLGHGAVWKSKTGDAPYKDVTRTLLGEGAGEEPFTFLTRYRSAGRLLHAERHQHPHAVS